ncbi:DNA-binding MarR family transcriptional regulator [Pararhizobium capsulatum DSM 1112]|uniref:DNA-binding MarR family transcriptional regulator n=1 Tax=Pararhizobium capsulatum DSM 1112 TaxID=1121113 RepID=A0ABU0BYR3_9HYPH|nr:MarR family winged helix-turn-helix transcriptional regulator [Pararhizobium capsulatum]MDQ0323093.1 DNA-binding MarR family transcriptional regulator [Pararhizobium capsulatum DSM 1112]
MESGRSKSIGHQINWTARLFAREMDRRVKSIGLSSSQLPVLLALADAEILSQKALVARSAVEQPAMARMLDRMEKEGLVRKKPDPFDGRGFLYSLTEKSRLKLPVVFNEMVVGNEKALRGISEAQVELLLQTLVRMNLNLADPDVTPPVPEKS